MRDRASVGEAGTDPAFVATEGPLPPALYWGAVREVLAPGAVRAVLAAAGADVRWMGEDRGVVGAAAAIAWPARTQTWEAIAYRTPDRWGTPRDVSAASVARAERALPRVFLCRDPATRRLLVAPHTPCPILFGVRATDARSARRAVPVIRSEPVDRWVLFATNQATGDHLVRREVRDLRPYTSARIRGIVAATPETRAGGHMRFALRDRSGATVDCLAFEPTKTLPRVAASLRPGDRVEVWGSRGREPPLRLEGIRLVAPGRLGPSVRGPTCPGCRRAARSMGRARGYRCPRCGARFPPERATSEPRRVPFVVGVHHPTPSARRHLAPLPAAA